MMKYIGAIPSTIMIHLNLQFLRILSTLFAALIYINYFFNLIYAKSKFNKYIHFCIFYHFVIFAKHYYY